MRTMIWPSIKACPINMSNHASWRRNHIAKLAIWFRRHNEIIKLRLLSQDGIWLSVWTPRTRPKCTNWQKMFDSIKKQRETHTKTHNNQQLHENWNKRKRTDSFRQTRINMNDTKRQERPNQEIQNKSHRRTRIVNRRDHKRRTTVVIRTTPDSNNIPSTWDIRNKPPQHIPNATSRRQRRWIMSHRWENYTGGTTTSYWTNGRHHLT